VTAGFHGGDLRFGRRDAGYDGHINASVIRIIEPTRIASKFQRPLGWRRRFMVFPLTGIVPRNAGVDGERVVNQGETSLDK
jgi:hypothetical protein